MKFGSQDTEAKESGTLDTYSYIPPEHYRGNQAPWIYFLQKYFVPRRITREIIWVEVTKYQHILGGIVIYFLIGV